MVNMHLGVYFGHKLIWVSIANLLLNIKFKLLTWEIVDISLAEATDNCQIYDVKHGYSNIYE